LPHYDEQMHANTLNKLKRTIYPRIYLYAIVLLLFAGCKLDNSITPSPAVKVISNSYQPVTKGSYWKYNYTQNNVSDTLTLTMTGLSIPLYNQTYYEGSYSFQSHKFPDATSYFFQDNHVYNKLTIAPGDTVNQYYFNDTTALNSTWMAKANNLGYINGLEARFAGQIAEQNINLTVEGVTYTGVSHSKVYLQYSSGEGFYTYATYDYFMVKGIGIIELFYVDTSGINISEALISYSLK
jgi:hypothetical protein